MSTVDGVPGNSVEPRLRHSARGVLLDPADRVLLVRFELRDIEPPTLWACPGGGVEPGESAVQTLRRELDEEVGLKLQADPPKVWHRRLVGPNLARGYEGVVEDYFLVRTAAFDPRGSFTDEELVAENLHEIRWWTLPEIANAGTTFAPRNMANELEALLRDGPPARPVQLRA
jgi:ADP-ribose pyrophosphatase YjhB (NUDIX family)